MTPLNIASEQELRFAQHLAGKRLLRSEIPFSKTEIEQLLSAGLLHPVPAIVRSALSLCCGRCFNDHPAKFGTIPCAKCGSQHRYCRHCIKMGRMMECEPLYEWLGSQPRWEQVSSPLTWNGQLSPLQQEAANIAAAAITQEQSELLLWAVCGAGKTEMLFPAVAKALTLGKRVCLASPRADVIRELLPRFRSAFAKTGIQALYGGSADKSATGQLILATTHQLLRFRQAFDVLIIDEVDAFPYHNDPQLHKVTDHVKKPVCTTIYLTATPRPSQIARIRRNKLPHHFIPCRFHGNPLPVPKLVNSLFIKQSLKRFMPPHTFFKWLKKRQNKQRQLLIFVPTIKLADQMQEQIVSRLIDEGHIASVSDLESVHAEDPDRESKVLDFRNKKTRILLTTTILERGVTFPSVDVAVIDAGHEVFDEAALVQIAGRAGRSSDDPDGEVCFFHDGRTEGMMKAVRSITEMNRRAGF
ncbi:DEAD/DEAH box helicase family protein [Aciduricibacillus chroicocephali]|uniref:DEAD/DEAH box helicase family protein n=1 Tax=Aciduricibacillus chroicocephali TaxID=3054939 RepID=A0ABY9KUR2_9BACI|nr:DEAD/DEAH box helicase family protein [Bacillaceae bacterium 44XB]